MQLKDLKPILYSHTGNIQLCIIYDTNVNADIEYGCSAEYAYKHYGDRYVERISSVFEKGQSYIVISIV